MQRTAALLKTRSEGRPRISHRFEHRPNFLFGINAKRSKSIQEPQPQIFPFYFNGLHASEIGDLASRRNRYGESSNPGWGLRHLLHWCQRAFRRFAWDFAETGFFRGEECRVRVPLGGPSRMRKIRSALLRAKGYPAPRLLPYQLPRISAHPADATIARPPAKQESNFSGGTT
jgi:hypothetical protein